MTNNYERMIQYEAEKKKNTRKANVDLIYSYEEDKTLVIDKDDKRVISRLDGDKTKGWIIRNSMKNKAPYHF